MLHVSEGVNMVQESQMVQTVHVMEGVVQDLHQMIQVMHMVQKS